MQLYLQSLASLHRIRTKPRYSSTTPVLSSDAAQASNHKNYGAKKSGKVKIASSSSKEIAQSIKLIDVAVIPVKRHNSQFRFGVIMNTNYFL